MGQRLSEIDLRLLLVMDLLRLLARSDRIHVAGALRRWCWRAYTQLPPNLEPCQ